MTGSELQFERWIARERLRVWEIYRKEGAEVAARYVNRCVKPFLKGKNEEVVWYTLRV